MKLNHNYAEPSMRITGGAIPPMLAPFNALRILRHRTGGTISRSTFYRWVNSGKVASIRLGTRLFVPWPELERLIRKCLAGDSAGAG